MFPVIVGIIIGGQIILINVGGLAFNCYSYGGLRIE